MIIDADKLIPLIAAKPVLWDRSLPQHHNQFKIRKLWRQVSEELGSQLPTAAIEKDASSSSSDEEMKHRTEKQSSCLQPPPQQQLQPIEFVESVAPKANTIIDDEDKGFFLSLLPHVRKLEPEDKLVFRMEAQKLVHQCVYRKSQLIT
ncbi:uncharacterized protein LOC129760978 [Uranotaenia lowii]|uniref:uncharacterized protein LOC129760978 n=1 Tax=Uranotaenia lowii TaxID=190385 RepID=UPI00247B175F|nr:uncharacterized protein LOC129760978 [Uranotaenia lowii]